MDTFCSFGLPYISSSYRGDINFAMRRKIRDFYSQIGEVTSIFIDGDYTRVFVKDINDLGVKFKKLIDESVTGTLNSSWENNPCEERKLPKNLHHLKKHRVFMWHTTRTLPEKAQKHVQNAKKLAYENIASQELENHIFEEEMDLFIRENEMEDNNDVVYLTDEDSELDEIIDEFNKLSFEKRNPLVIVFDSDDEDSEEEETYVKKEYTREEVLELMKLRILVKRRMVTTKDMMYMLNYSQEDTIEIMKRYGIMKN